MFDRLSTLLAALVALAPVTLGDPRVTEVTGAVHLVYEVTSRG